MAELSKAIARLMEQRERDRERARSDNGGAESRDAAPNARAQVPVAERSLAENFVRHFVDAAATEDIDDAELRLLAMIAFRFVADRSPEEPRIRVFDPSVVQDGWESSGTVVQIVMRERPFLVDTVRQCLADHGTSAQRLLSPTFRIERDQRRAVVAVGPPTATGSNEIFIHAEVERLPDPHAVATLLRRHLREGMAAADDSEAMRERLGAIVEDLDTKSLPRPWNTETADARAFLEWLGADNFVFLGYREYQLAGQGNQRTAVAREGSGLGLLRDAARSSFATPQRLSDPLRHRLNEPPLLMITKTNAETVVHRKARMDYVGVKEVDSSGVVVGERRFLGLFTKRMYAAESTSIPWLARKLEIVREGEGVAEGSDAAQQIRTVFNSIPKAELFALSEAELSAEIAEIRAARGTGTLRVSSRTDAIGRGVFVLVIMPRERFSADVRGRIEERLVRALQAAAILDREVVTGDGGDVRLHFYFAATTENLRLLGSDDLLSEVADLMRSWDDRLRHELSNRFPGHGRELADKYTGLLSRAYKDSTDVLQAVEDVRCLEALRKEHGAHVELIDLGAKAERRSLLRFYQIGEGLALGDLVGALGNFGLRVSSVQKQEVSVPDVGAVFIHSFDIEASGPEQLDLEAIRPLLPPALMRLRAGHFENDPINSLIVRAKLTWEQVELVRVYVNYCADAGLAPSREALLTALVNAPEAAHLLWLYFEARFDPTDDASARDREERVLPAAAADFRAVLDPLGAPTDAALLARLFSCVAATVRTNFFVPTAPAAGGKPARGALALRLDGSKLPPLPGRRAAYEIYVDGRNVRGLLLCDGPTARAAMQAYGDGAGLRSELSKRLPGETLSSFMSAPEAAVGGWAVARRPGAQPEAALRTYLAALLDVTDNVEHGRVVPAPGVVAYDSFSPVLTLVLPEGTIGAAKIANQLAQERGYWLGDAFAAGQSSAFERRRLETAARGAWEGAQWHFVEAGGDRETGTLSVVGVGDMSDAAFGSGMVASRRFRLQAAIGEQHFFLDPDPDVSKSFAERERLFNLPRSTWSDYDRELLSPGGGVYPLASTAIPLSDEVRRMLGFSVVQEVATPVEIVKAIFAMEADLLWLGGRGTIVRGSSETAERGDVGAPPGIPIAAVDVKAKVVAEPRPDAVTQRARIEYAQRGGRINTAAVDGAAGVDLTDHEVNFKLVTSAALQGSHLTASQRAQLLEESKPQALSAVLVRSLAHVRAITLEQRRSQTQLDDFRQLAGQHVADDLATPDILQNFELAAGRRGPWGGLSRPELGDLLALTKRSLQRRILASDVPEDAFLETYLRAYFPDSLNASCGQQIRSHKLRREIIAAELARLIVESMGVTFVDRLCRETGAEAPAVIRAWAVVVETSGALGLWDEVGNADPPLPLRGELACWEALARAIESATRWVLQTQPPEATAGGVFDMYAEPTRELLRALPRLLPSGQLARINERVAALAREGIPRALPERIVPLDSIADVLDIVEIASEYGLERETVTELYYEIGDLLDVDWVRDRIADLAADTRWERRARNSLNEGLLYVRKELTRRILLSRQESIPIRSALEEYLVEHQERLTHLGELIDDITSAQRPSLAALMVIVREYGHLVERYA